MFVLSCILNMEAPKVKLSKHILQMKFMQKCKEKIEKEEEKKQTEEFFDSLNLPKISGNGLQFLIEPSYAKCENLVFGRMSFREFNVDVEKYMKSKDTMNEVEVEEKETIIGITDKEMTARFSSLIGTISKKFGKKRKSNEEPKVPNKFTFRKIKND